VIRALNPFPDSGKPLEEFTYMVATQLADEEVDIQVRHILIRWYHLYGIYIVCRTSPVRLWDTLAVTVKGHFIVACAWRAGGTSYYTCHRL
jgi:hypothetical protein